MIPRPPCKETCQHCIWLRLSRCRGIMAPLLGFQGHDSCVGENGKSLLSNVGRLSAALACIKVPHGCTTVRCVYGCERLVVYFLASRIQNGTGFVCSWLVGCKVKSAGSIYCICAFLCFHYSRNRCSVQMAGGNYVSVI